MYYQGHLIITWTGSHMSPSALLIKLVHVHGDVTVVRRCSVVHEVGYQRCLLQSGLGTSQINFFLCNPTGTCNEECLDSTVGAV